MTPSAGMFKSLDWMSVNNGLKYNKAIFTYKAMNGLTPSYISDLLKPIAKTCSRYRGALKREVFFHTLFCVLVRICNQTSSNQHLLVVGC